MTRPRYGREAAVGTVYLAMLAGLAVFAPRFFRPESLRATVVSQSAVLVAAVGMTVIILCRQIDISIGSQFSVCGVVAGLMARSGAPVPVAALGAVAAGGFLGAVNGLLVAGMGLPSIVATLATLVIWRESLRYARQGEFVRDLPADFQWFGAGGNVGPWLTVLAAVVVFVLFAWGLRYLNAGRMVYATGSDPEAARLAGIRPRAVVFFTFVLMGSLAGLAALLSAVRFVAVDPNAGGGLELQVIAAVVVGGTSINGGRGRLAGSLLGVVLLGTVGTALTFLHLEAYWEKAIQGAIILLAVASDSIGGGRR